VDTERRRKRDKFEAKYAKKDVTFTDSHPDKWRHLEDLGLDMDQALAAGIPVVGVWGWNDEPWFGTVQVTQARRLVNESASPEEQSAKETKRAETRLAKERKEHERARLGERAKDKVSQAQLVAQAAQVIASLLHQDEARLICNWFDLSDEGEQYPRWGQVARNNLQNGALIRAAYVALAENRPWGDNWPEIKAQLLAEEG
jgi:multidrug efflux pump subunit AcrA (membrane-fusion protein)